MLFLISLVLCSPFFASVNLANFQPLYLINSAFHEAHFETEYVALDQCTRWGTEQTRHDSFALKFQITGKCENGFLICYPGALDPSANSAFGMRPEVQFQVPNHPNDVMLINYAGLWMLGLDFLPMNNRDTLQMHVYRDCGCEMHAWFAHPSDDSPLKRSRHPDVSADCPAKIVDSLAEHFALEKPLQMDRSIRLRQRLNKNPKKMLFWFGNQHKKHLLEMTVEEPPNGLIDIKSMQDNKTNEEFVDNETRKLARERKFKAMDDEDEEEKGGGEEGGGGEGEEGSGKGGKGTNKDKYIEVQLVARKYFYEVKVGDRKVFNYFPKSDEWWKTWQMEDITQVEVAGDVYPDSVGVPKVDEKQPKNEKPISNSYVVRLERTLKEGDTVVLKGQIDQPQHPEKGLTLFFGLLHNSPGFNELVSVMPWFLSQADGRKIAIGKYDPEESYDSNPTDLKLFEAGEPFEMQIKLLKRPSMDNLPMAEILSSLSLNLTMTVIVSTPKGTSQTNYTLDSESYRDMNYITVRGDLELFAEPSLLNDITNDENSERKMAFEVFPLLSVGDSILLEGKLKDNATIFKINLFHDVNEKNPYASDLVLQILFNFTGDGTIQLSSLIHQISNKQFDEYYAFPSTLFPGEQFKIEIGVTFEMFKIYVYGALAANFTHLLPSWSVDYLNVEGDYEEGTLSKFAVDRTKGVFPNFENRSLAVPYVMEVPPERLIRSHDSITIMGKVTKENATVSVLLLNQAIETYDTVPKSVIDFMDEQGLLMVGRVVSRADFYTDSEGKGRVDCSFLARNNTYEGKQSFTFEPALAFDDDFTLKISFKNHFEYNLYTNDFNIFVYENNKMPSWAIEYIRIEGDLALDELPDIEDNSPALKDLRSILG
ncbi:hypothetical protein niasHT_034398 [Heterodera trifolii]|uniref:Galectin domain-containing protein n=1 Tax=Heterodera trifolii TaxID=157864 RepID=A0ABD2I7P5_9BILA